MNTVFTVQVLSTDAEYECSSTSKVTRTSTVRPYTGLIVLSTGIYNKFYKY